MRPTRPIRRITGAVVAVVVAAVALAVPASATTVSISRFTATPTSIAGSGGTVTFTIRTAGATSCRLASSITIAGLPAAVACSTSSKTVSVPASTSSAARTITFTLTAANGTQHKSAQVAVAQAKAVAPVITTLTRTPTTVNADTSTKVSINATTNYAKTCTLSATPSVPGVPYTTGCSGGTFAHTITVPAASSASPRTITFTLTAIGPTGLKAHRSVSVSGRPLIRSLTASPTSLGYPGGTLTITGTVAQARTCTLTSSPDLGSASGDCSVGTFSHQFSVPGNSGTSDRTYSFTLKATSAGGSVTASTTVTAHPQPTLVTLITASPVSVPAAGATVTVSAGVQNATTCSVSSAPDIGSDSSIDCTGGVVSHDFVIAQNTTNAPRSFVFTVAASGVSPGASATVSVTQPAAPPSIRSLTGSATAVPAAGGTFTVSAVVSDATTCAITRTGYADPASVIDCSGGSGGRPFDFLSNTTDSANHYVFTLTAFNSDGSAIARADLAVRQPQESGASSVSVDSISVSPSAPPADGGLLTVTAHVSGATGCSFSSPDLNGTSEQDCSSGTASAQFTIPPNAGSTYAQYTFNVVASGVTADTGSLTVYAPPPPPGVTSVSVVPTAVGADGGEIDISAETVNANVCKIAIDAGALLQISCDTTGFGGVQQFLPANTSGHFVMHTITVQVSDDVGTATGVVQVPQAAP